MSAIIQEVIDAKLAKNGYCQAHLNHMDGIQQLHKNTGMTLKVKTCLARCDTIDYVAHVVTREKCTMGM